MPKPICIPDNHPGLRKELSQSQWDDLKSIAGKKVSSLCRMNGSEGSLLVFPNSLDAYGDKIGDTVVFGISEDRISTGNLIGFIGRKDTALKIYSRFDRDGNDFFMHYMLGKVFSINLFDLPHNTDAEDIFDFVIFLFPYFLRRALSQGLYRQYITYHRNDTHVRGSIDIVRHIRKNIPFTGFISYNSREYTEDNDMTELIRHTVEFIRMKPYGNSILMQDEETKGYVADIVRATPEYDPHNRGKIISRNLRPKMHPYYFEYEPLRHLCIQILQQEEIKYGEQDEKVYGILFDGAWLWETYLNTLFEGMNLHHPDNKTGHGRLYLFSPDAAPRYPDFWGDGIVLDAKYKGYDGKPVTQVGREDLAQVISYMYILQARLGGFLVPGTKDASLSIAELNSAFGGEMFLLSLLIPMGIKSFDSFIRTIRGSESFFVSEISRLWNSRMPEK